MKTRNPLIITSLALALTGCLSSPPEAPVNWTVEWMPGGDTAAVSPRFGLVRPSLVVVRAPYDGSRIAVLRPDGSIAFDAFNVFAASPAALLRGAVGDVLSASGEFAGVLDAASSANAQYLAEVTVRRLALDCRKEGRRDACVDLTFTLLEGRRPVATKSASASEPAPLGNYSAAFSAAFARALQSAVGAALDDAKAASDRKD